MNQAEHVPEPPEMTPARAMEMAREILAKSRDPYWKNFRNRIEEGKEERRRAFEAFLSDDDVPDDDPPGAVDEALRSLDEGRPHRPLFQNMD